ncbi:hypothetical protein D3C79_1043910 [compost metagenome]
MAEFFASCEQFAADEVQCIGALLWCACGPARLCLLGGCNSHQGVVTARLSVQADRVVEV